jgi:pimeloyl-ACP methyl ester carboxylesterase
LRVALGALLVLVVAAGGLWLVYGESVRVLHGLVTALGEPLPEGVTRHPLTVEGAIIAHADVYEPAGGPRAVLLLVPGLTPAGREDAKVVGVSGVLADAGFRVVAPDLPGAIRLAAGPDDVAVLATLLDRLAGERAENDLPIGIVAISYGLGPALAAASEPDRAAAVDMVLGLGGYHDGRAIVRYLTTGFFTDPRDEVERMGRPDGRARWLLLYATLDHVASAEDRARLRTLAQQGIAGDPPGLVETTTVMAQGGDDARALLALVANTEPDHVDERLDALTAGARDALVALSPSAFDLAPLEGRLLLVHGEADPVIPYSESLRLAAAVPGSRVVLVPDFSHVEPGETGLRGRLAMIRAVKALLDLRQ